MPEWSPLPLSAAELPTRQIESGGVTGEVAAGAHNGPDQSKSSDGLANVVDCRARGDRPVGRQQESMPIMAASTLGCLHWRQVRERLAATGAAVVGAIVVPYGAELLRCVTTTDRE